MDDILGTDGDYLKWHIVADALGIVGDASLKMLVGGLSHQY